MMSDSFIAMSVPFCFVDHMPELHRSEIGVKKKVVSTAQIYVALVFDFIYIGVVWLNKTGEIK